MSEQEQQLRASRARLEVLAKAGLELSSSLDYAQTLVTVANIVVSCGLADSCAVSLATREGELERVALQHRDPKMTHVIEVLRRYPPRAGGNFALRAYRERRTLVAEATTDEYFASIAEDEAHLAALRELGTRRAVAVPLMYADRALGSLILSASTPEIRYDSETVAVIEAVALRCASAIEHARIFTEERRLRIDRERVVQRVTLLQDISNGLASAATVKDSAQLAINLVVSHLNAVAGAIALREHEDLVTISAVGYAPEVFQRLAAMPSAANSAAHKVVRSGNAAFFGDYAEYAAQYPEIASVVSPQSNHAIAVVPLRAQNDVLGALVVRFGEPRVFAEDEKRLLDSVAQQCAQALARAQAFDRERAARDEAARANHAKDEFIAMLGHELRNPLAPIATIAHLLSIREVTPKHVRILQRQVDHLRRLVDDLLDISRITRGVFELNKNPLDLKDVLRAVVDAVNSGTEIRRHRFVVELPDESLPIEGDRQRLVQVFSNLLANAIKYTEPGGQIVLSATRTSTDVEVVLADSGIGLSKDLVDRVFDMFAQAPQAKDRSRGGLGLGLAIVKRLVEAHGGSVAVHSDGPGTGATFRVSLPMSQRTPTVSSPPLGSAYAGNESRVLVVDDNVDAATTLSDLLTLLGYSVRFASDASSALAIVNEFVPHAAVLDIGLPGIDGHQLGELLRARLGPIGLVAVSGYTSSRDIELSKSVGFDAHFAKPVDPNSLVAELQRILNSRS